MADPFEPMVPGQSLDSGVGPFNLDWHNAVTEVVRRQIREKQAGFSQDEYQVSDDPKVWVANVENVSIAQYEAVGIRALATFPGDNTDFRNRMCFVTATLQANQPFGIAQESIGTNEQFAAKSAIASGGLQPPNSSWVRLIGSVSAWSASERYLVGEQVTDGGDTFVCIRPNTNVATTNATYWIELKARRGPWSNEAYAVGEVALISTVGEIVVSGTSRALIHVGNARHRYAGPSDLGLSSQVEVGPLEIIWKEAGTGPLWAIVRFLAGDFEPVTCTGTGALSFGVLGIDGTGLRMGGDLVTGVMTLDGTGTFTPPVRTASGALTFAAATLSATGRTYFPHPGGSLYFGELTISGTGTVVNPPRGKGYHRTRPMTLSGTGTSTKPTCTGTGAMTFGVMDIDSHGLQLPDAPTYTVTSGDGTVGISTTVAPGGDTAYDLSARVADATHSGIVSTTTQELAGEKRFTSVNVKSRGSSSTSYRGFGVVSTGTLSTGYFYHKPETGGGAHPTAGIVVSHNYSDEDASLIGGSCDASAGAVLNCPALSGQTTFTVYGAFKTTTPSDTADPYPSFSVSVNGVITYGQWATVGGMVFSGGLYTSGSLSVAEANLASQAVAPSKLKDADFGAFTIASGVATLDAGVVAPSNLADGDFGDFSVSSGVATIEADAVTNAKLANATAYSFKANLTSGSANPTDVTLADLTAEAAPASGDYFLVMLADGSFAKVDYDDLPGGGAGDVTAASTFGTDNRLIRSDGTTKGVQASGITVDDSDNVTGVATLNKVTITAPATGSTLTIADGKTATISNTITITATDGSTLAIGTGGTLGSAAYTASTVYAAVANNLSDLANAGTSRTNLGGTTVGQSYFTLTNPSAITFPRMNADNTVSALSASDFRTAIGAGTGGGSVTSVDVSGGSTGLSASGGPVTSSGTITLAGTLVVANGGTGVVSTTAYAVLCGGTTSTGALQSVASVGTAGQVLTSNGAGALPTFQTVSGGSGNRVSVVTETAKSTTFTAVWGEYYPCSGTSYTITLPTASGNAGKICAFRVTASGTLTLDGNSSETVGGRTTLALITGDYIELQSDGTNVQIAVFTHADWVSYTPTINGVSSNPTKGGTRTELCLYKRDGRDMLMQYLYRQTSAGAAGSGYYLHVLPRSASVDTSFVQTGDFSSFGNVGSLLGAGDTKTTGVVASIGVYAYSSTDLILAGFYDSGGAGGGGVGSAFFNMGLSEIIYTFTARVPISGW